MATQASDSKSQWTRTNFLPFSPPAISEREIKAVVDTLRSGWITTGPKVKQFEKSFADYIGADAAHAINSCTGGLHIALLALGIGPGDEVITTSMTFCSSVHVIEHVGATPVLVDIEPDILTLDPRKAAEAVTPKTKAIMPVHYAGHSTDMNPLIQLANQHGLYIVEDAAHAFPAAYNGQTIGTIGDLTAFSFYATKNLTTAEGGMLTGAAKYVEKARLFSRHGMDRDAWKRYSATGSWYYEVIEPGFKYNMTDIQAAIGLVQLKRIEKMQQRRHEIARQYHEAFGEIPELEIPTVRTDVSPAWHLYVLRLHLERVKIDRARFIEELRTRNIGTSVHFVPVHLHPFYREKYKWAPEDFPVTYEQYRRVLSLPLHPGLTDRDVNDVIHAVTDVVERYRR